MRTLIAIAMLVACVPPAAADDHWQGAMTRAGVAIPIEIDVAGSGARFTSPDQAVREYPFDTVKRDGSAIHLVLGGNVHFDGQLSGSIMRGTTSDGATFELARKPAAVPPYRREDVRFENGAVTLHGTLLVPPSARAAVVFVHGSGPETRWGRSLFYADVLARHGIAALVYDKRGAGESTGDWKTVGYDALGDDALAAIRFVHARGIARVGLFGHSEGGTLGPLTAARSRDVAFLISAAGIAGPIVDQDVLRGRHNLEDHGFAPRDVDAALAFYRRWLEVARAGGAGWDGVAALVAGVEHATWYGWVELPPRDSWVWAWYPRVADVDAVHAWEQVHVPVLVVYGQRDRIEAVDDYLAAIDRSLRTAGNHDVTELILPGAAHNLTVAPPADPFDDRVAPGWPELLADWVVAHAR